MEKYLYPLSVLNIHSYSSFSEKDGHKRGTAHRRLRSGRKSSGREGTAHTPRKSVSERRSRNIGVSFASHRANREPLDRGPYPDFTFREGIRTGVREHQFQPIATRSLVRRARNRRPERSRGTKDTRVPFFATKGRRSPESEREGADGNHPSGHRTARGDRRRRPGPSHRVRSPDLRSGDTVRQVILEGEDVETRLTPSSDTTPRFPTFRSYSTEVGDRANVSRKALEKRYGQRTQKELKPGTSRIIAWIAR